MTEAPSSWAAARARALLDPEMRRCLEPFLGERLGTAEAAALIGLTVEQMAYRVGRLAKLGLLDRVGERARAGRSIAVYAAPPEARVPLAALPEADSRTVFALLDEPGRSAYLDALARQSTRHDRMDWVLRLRRGPSGVALLDVIPAGEEWTDDALTAPHAPAIAFHWVPAVLDDEQAKALQRVLADIAAGTPTGTAPTHLVGLFLAPL